MFKTLKQLFVKKNKDLRHRLYFTMAVLSLYIIGTTIEIPGTEEITKNLGFLELLNVMGGGALGQFLVIAGLLIFKSPILIITGFVPVFFDNATIAVFAEKRGGVRAAMILPFISGMLQVIMGAAAVLLFKLQGFGGWHGNIDQSTLWVGQGFIINNFGMIGYIVAILFMLMIPIIQYKKLNNPKLYFNNEVEEM